MKCTRAFPQCYSRVMDWACSCPRATRESTETRLVAAAYRRGFERGLEMVRNVCVGDETLGWLVDYIDALKPDVSVPPNPKEQP